MDGVAKTSLLVAAMRARESQRSEIEGRLFLDPFAEELAGVEGLSLLKSALEESGDQPAIAVRTRYMDDKIKMALSIGVKQIVILASGMDSRSYRLEFPLNTTIYELDQKAVLEYKQRILMNKAPQCRLVSLPIDLNADWTKLLHDSGFSTNSKTLWLVEGLLMYLDEIEVNKLFQRINSIANSYDILLMDVLTSALLKVPHMQKQLQFLSKMGAPWKFGISEEPEEFMEKLGWNATATQPGEYIPDRWPFPVQPRIIPGVPRSYFVEAIKK